MNLSPIKVSTEPKCYPSPLSRRLSPLSIIHTFQAATTTLNSQNYSQWYTSAMNLIKLIDSPVSNDIDSAASSLKLLPILILENSKKPIATEGFKSICGVILNFLSKANLIEEGLKAAVMEYLGSIYQHLAPRRTINSGHKKNCKVTEFDEIKEELNSQVKMQYGLDSFLNICRLQNEKNISVNVCDDLGRFVICDKFSENIFENKKEALFKSSLFDLMIPLSFEYLRRKTQKGVLTNLQEINSEGVFSYTIYSQNAKKKYLKFLNKYRQEIAEAEVNALTSIKEENHTQNEESSTAIKGIELFYKFMKGLTTRVRRVEVKVDKKILAELLNEEVNEEYPFVINRKHPFIESILENKWLEDKETILDVALIETRVSKHIQKFNYMYMKFDPKIKNQEEKIQSKIRKKIKKEEDENGFLNAPEEFTSMKLKDEVLSQSDRKNHQNFFNH